MNRLMGDFEVASGGNLVSFTSLVDGAERFENRDWGPIKDHYQQKQLTGENRGAIKNQPESQMSKRGAMGQLSVGPR